jgi:hypothetical protein
MQSETRTHRTARRAIGTVVLALALGACGASTKIDQSWVAPQAATQPRMQRVATVFISDNATMRHSAEDKLASDLYYRNGIQATPGYTVLGNIDVKNLDAVKDALRARGFDGLVTMKIVDREQTLEGTPAYDWYWGYWGWGYGYPGYGGYTYTETTYRVETSAYDLRNNQLVWSVMTKTTEPENARHLIDDTSTVVTRKFVKPLSG